MPAVIPARPAAGAVVATDWGQDVHDRIYTPRGAMVSGAVLTGIVGTQLILPIDSLVVGNGAFVDAAGDRLVIPSGASGLYEIGCHVQVSNTLSWVRVQMVQGGVNSSQGQTVRGIAGFAMAAFTALNTLADGAYIQFGAVADAADAADVQITRAWVLRRGDAFG